MDILKPALIRIGNRCYRKNPVLGEEQTADLAAGSHGYGVFDEESINEHDMYGDESCDISSNVEKTDGEYRISLEIPSAYFKYIIGKKGETKKRLETETKTQIRIPKQGNEGPIVINGHERCGMLSAKTRINVLVESARQKQPFTHFLSFPVRGEELQSKFLEFQDDILLHCDGDRGLDKTLFQNPDKLHLTIGTLVLMNDAEISQAVHLLQQCKHDLIEPILKGKQLLCNFEGLEYMNDDPNAVNVLYGKVQPLHDSDSLQMLADRLADKFTAADLLQHDYDSVKIHVTLLNTLFRKDPTGTAIASALHGKSYKDRESHGKSYKDRESFDASNILKKYRNYDFGVCDLNELHLSQRHSTGKDGYYLPAASIRLP